MFFKLINDRYKIIAFSIVSYTRVASILIKKFFAKCIYNIIIMFYLAKQFIRFSGT